MNYHLCMSQFKTSVILCIQNFAKNDTENAELASKMLRQQHFLHQRKNLYNQLSLRSSSSEPDPEDTHRQLARWSLSFYPAISPRTLSGVAERGPGASLRLRKYREDGGDFSITGCKTKTLHKDCLTSARVHGSTLRWNVCVMYQKYIV